MKKKAVAKVRYMEEVASIDMPLDQSLLESLVKAKVPIGRSCDGEGICTTCRIILVKGEVTEPGPLELERIKERGFLANERLACQCKPVSDKLHIQVP